MTTTVDMNEVRFDRVNKAYGNDHVLDNCSFEIPSGKFTALVGPSGCGKSTLVNLIAGYEPTDSGTVTMDGKKVTHPGWDRLVVFQETALFPWKTILENVIFGPRNRGIARAVADQQARELLAKFGLAGFEDKYSNQLSGGMQRRAELARAMINSPNIMLMDEPFRGLDAMTRELMQEYLLKVFQEHPITTLFVTSEIEEAIYLADRVIVLSAKPTRVKLVIDVDLPRPRNIKMLSSNEFGRIHSEILDCLFAEASKAFGSAEGGSDILKGAADILEGYKTNVK
jgi:NitT/TauT family transport system ATP-binding protein